MKHLVAGLVGGLLLTALMLILLLNPQGSLAQNQKFGPSYLANFNFKSSWKYHDVLMDSDVVVDSPTYDDSQWLPPNPGAGKTKFKTAIYIPRDYLDQVGVHLSDEEIFSMLSQQTQASINDYANFADATYYHDLSQIVVHSDFTLEEMLCTYSTTCENWNYLAHRALVDAKEADADPDAYYAVYVFGGAGFAGALSDAFVIGDWGFSLLFGYTWPNCGAMCNLDDFYFTVRHEMGHGHGMSWHPGRYPNYPHVSIMDGGDWDQFYLLDHPGYPELYQVCMSSLNIGVKSCSDRFISPSRPKQDGLTLHGHLFHPRCERYDSSQRIFFSRSPFGSGMGNRYYVASAPISDYGEFSIDLSEMSVFSWQRGFALTVADQYPYPNPDFNEFVHGYQFHFDPVQNLWCDDMTGQQCQDTYHLVLEVPDSACAELRPDQTRPVVPADVSISITPAITPVITPDP